ncbi:hypothetical protein BGZ61DRAFT_226747 [Ilyonectria robusta]|uniref:uncharacterized protein n=1 Tax=Ilyonectria robusta TaxID=1079257 RepID=UPI001E8D39C8|nr:uncharacterized protein BGZ61DRAFT_226747 [Ilyonectria robusta]KAH8706759.1 hypothetical protein BGZ61DRAFT_226747 [Ilyonectria robusta]
MSSRVLCFGMKEGSASSSWPLRLVTSVAAMVGTGVVVPVLVLFSLIVTDDNDAVERAIFAVTYRTRMDVSGDLYRRLIKSVSWKRQHARCGGRISWNLPALAPKSALGRGAVDGGSELKEEMGSVMLDEIDEIGASWRWGNQDIYSFKAWYNELFPVSSSSKSKSPGPNWVL